jgi:large subunit ribosomal protein L1
MKKVDHKPSKRYLAATQLVEKNKAYSIEEAIALIKQTSTVKFDASLDLHVKLGINPKKTDQQVRSNASLPHGTGKTIKIAVVSTDGDQLKNAKASGADLVGDQELINEIKEGKVSFDVLVATPEAMKLLAPIAKILGPKGLMPNPKDGTVSANAGEAVANLKKGKVSFKNDDSANIHVMFGKTSFEDAKLVDNFKTVIDTIIKAKPSAAKGTFIKNITIASSMGPGIKIAL